MVMPESTEEPETLEKEATHMLEEARMVLPGVQALFGFQLIAVYSARFARVLDEGQQRIHLLSVFLTALTVVLTMFPVAYHRQAEPHEITRGFVKRASLLLMIGMFTLMLSLWLDCYLISCVIVKDRLASLLAVALFGAVHVGLWFLMPRLARRRRARRG